MGWGFSATLNVVTDAKRFFSDQTGTTAIEYALIAVGISIAILASVQLVGADVSALYDRIAGAVAKF
jgi:pilus assembly protein Flp/PilA